MALTGPYYWDGTNFPKNAGVLTPTLITQAEFEACCCPCDGCSGAQNDIVITGDGTGACDIAGTYEFVFFLDFTDFCQWYFTVESSALILIYCKLTKTFCAATATDVPYLISYGIQADTCNNGCGDPESAFPTHTDVGTPLTCVAGQLTGHLSLQGDDNSGTPGGTDCSSFSISVSFSGG